MNQLGQLVYFDRKKLTSDILAVMTTYIVNCCILIFLSIIVFLFLNDKEVSSIFNKYQDGQYIYFLTPTKDNFVRFLQYGALLPAIIEEVLYRGPIWFLIYYGFKLKNQRLNWLFLLLAIACLDYQWASYHTFRLPIFIIGLPFYVLTIKTKNIFAPMLCHFLSNLSIYILLQISLYFKTI